MPDLARITRSGIRPGILLAWPSVVQMATNARPGVAHTLGVAGWIRQRRHSALQGVAQSAIRCERWPIWPRTVS